MERRFLLCLCLVMDEPRCKDEWCDRLCRLIGAFSGQCTSGGGCACAL